MNRTTSALEPFLRRAEQAKLLPVQLDEGLPDVRNADGSSERRIGGFSLVVMDAVNGQVLPPSDRTWLAFSPFDVPTATHTRKLAPPELVVARMRFIILSVRLALTRHCDWQCQMDTTLDDEYPRGDPNRAWQWQEAISRLVRNACSARQHGRTMASLRWSHHPRFRIEWQHDPVIPSSFASLLETFLFASLGGVDAADAVAVGDKQEQEDEALLRALLKKEDQPAATQPPLVIKIALVFGWGRLTLSMLSSILDVLDRFGAAQQENQQQEQQRLRQDGTSLPPPRLIEFRVTSLAFQGSGEIASSALAELGALVRSSPHLHLDTIQLGSLYEAESLCVQKCLQDLTPHHGLSTNRNNLQRLLCTSANQDFAVFGSTVRSTVSPSSSPLVELDIGYCNTKMDSLAAWLAFGLFHHDSSSSVTKLTLRMPGAFSVDDTSPPYGSCSSGWIQVFTRVLGQVAASKDLAPIDSKTLRAEKDLEENAMPVDKQLFVELAAKTKARGQPNTRSPLVAVIGGAAGEGGHVRTYQVVRKVLKWVAVVVPGAGAGWIPAKAVQVEHLLDSCVIPQTQTQTQMNNKVTSFAWIGGSLPESAALRETHADTLMELLKIIGKPLVELHLPHMALQTHHLPLILSYCPNLKELNVALNEIRDLTSLVRGYGNGTCSISSLSVAQQEDGEHNSPIVHQIDQILQLETHPIQQLALRITPTLDAADDRFRHRPADEDNQVVVAFLQKVVQNQPSKLEYLRIHCHRTSGPYLFSRVMYPHLPSGSAPPTGYLRPRDEACMVSRSLPFTSKLAWLSVVAAMQRSDNNSNGLSQLDTNVIALIFALAKTCHPREVDLLEDSEDIRYINYIE